MINWKEEEKFSRIIPVADSPSEALAKEGLKKNDYNISPTDAIGFAYGATWNTVRRCIFNWKCEPHGHSLEPQISQMGADKEEPEKDLRKSASSAVETPGRLETKVKTFCAIPQVLAFQIVCRRKVGWVRHTDWEQRTNNGFLLVSQFSVTDALYT